MQRFIIISLLLACLVCYIQWGDRAAFLFQVEYELIFSGKNAKENFSSPVIFLPLSGQLLLLFSLLQKRPRRGLIITGIIFLSLLVLLILLAGILSRNLWMVLSTVPFLTAAIYYVFWYSRRHNSASGYLKNPYN